MVDTEDLVVGTVLNPLLVTDLTVTGGAIARYHGRVVFLDQGLLGDVVSATVTGVKKKSIEATVVETLSASPYTAQPMCPHFGVCGGCTWQNISYPALLEWKQRHVQETLIRIGRLEGILTEPVLASPKTEEYRNKLSFAFGSHGGQTIVGFRQRLSHDIVQVTNCMLQPAKTMEVLNFVRAALQESPIPAQVGKEGYLRFLVVRMPELAIDGVRPCYVEFITGHESRGSAFAYAEAVRALAKKLMESDLGITGVVHSERKNIAPIAQGEKVLFSLGSPVYQERIGSLELTLPVTAFLQTNTGSAGLLYEEVKKLAQIEPTDVVWDVYCGAGGIGLFAASHAVKLVGFDLQKDAIVAARKNAKSLGIAHASFYAGDLATLLPENKTQPDVIILDPPRSGIAHEVIAVLSATKAKRIIYISCDVATQARDIARLVPYWKPVKAAPVDMFPYTPHVENIVVLERNS